MPVVSKLPLLLLLLLLLLSCHCAEGLRGTPC
jgi:hypothetical protein